MKNQTLACMLLGLFFLGSFFANVFTHELGHYAVAEAAGLQPKMHADFSTDNTAYFTTTGFFVSYNAESSDFLPIDGLIAFAGPLMNVILLAVILTAYFKMPKKTTLTKLFFAALLIPTVLSVVFNLLPFAGADGSIILNSFAK